MMTYNELVLILATILVGLQAGVMYTFLVATVPGLRASKPKTHLEAMNQINYKIENPLFFLSFFGAFVITAYAAFLFRNTDVYSNIVVAALLILVISIGVTIIGNIPINRKMQAVDVNKLSEVDAKKLRAEFQGQYSHWMKWHSLRVLSTLIAFVILLRVLLDL